MSEIRKHRLSVLLFLVLPLIGATVGLTIQLMSPAEHPSDRVFFVFTYTVGLGFVGVLLSYLLWLVVNRRISLSTGVAAFAAPFAVILYLWVGKNGIPSVSALIAMAVVVVAFSITAQSLERISQSDHSVDE